METNIKAHAGCPLSFLCAVLTEPLLYFHYISVKGGKGSMHPASHYCVYQQQLTISNYIVLSSHFLLLLHSNSHNPNYPVP